MKVYIRINKIIERISQILSYVGAVWIFLLMGVIAVDVLGRQLFNTPLTGTLEIVRNSVAGIAFVLLPWAMVKDTHVRSTIVIDHTPKKVSVPLDILAYLIGLIVFIAIVFSSWEPFLSAFINKEYEGEGALRVVTWPVKAAIIMGCSFTAWHSLKIIITKMFPQKLTNAEKGGPK